MRTTAWILVLLNVLVLAFGVRGGFAHLYPERQQAGLQGTLGPASPGTAGPTLTLLPENATPGPAEQRRKIRDDRATAHAPPGVSVADSNGRTGERAGAKMRREVPDVGTARRGGDTDLSVPGQAAAAVAEASSAMAPPATPATAPPIATSKSEQPETCLIAGPFRVGPDSVRSRFEAVASDAGVRVLERESRSSGPVRHWVVLDGFDAHEQAQAAVGRLRAAGYTDVAPLETPEGWVVSLGVFGQKTRAGEHRDAVRAAGFDAVLRERASGPERQWLHLSAPSAGAVEGLRAALGDGTTLNPCPAGGR